MGDYADIDRIVKRTESVTNDVKELANIAAECPTVVGDSENICNRNSDNEINYNHHFLGTSAFS